LYSLTDLILKRSERLTKYLFIVNLIRFIKQTATTSKNSYQHI